MDDKWTLDILLQFKIQSTLKSPILANNNLRHRLKHPCPPFLPFRLSLLPLNLSSQNRLSLCLHLFKVHLCFCADFGELALRVRLDLQAALLIPYPLLLMLVGDKVRWLVLGLKMETEKRVSNGLRHLRGPLRCQTHTNRLLAFGVSIGLSWWISGLVRIRAWSHLGKWCDYC